ncbi:GH32 C-terminal domain-containing protein [Paenibacillus sp. FSL R10-2736]|uniref:GH32 C-terminal domain-containing protein n=1 Tax=Paenibacillus sp. FSL R10-2736 TaxID=2954692 RepID=UPI0040468B7D
MQGRLKRSKPIYYVQNFSFKSVIEVFAIDELCISARVYPILEQSNRVRIFAQKSVEVKSFQIWEMNAIS